MLESEEISVITLGEQVSPKPKEAGQAIGKGIWGCLLRRKTGRIHKTYN